MNVVPNSLGPNVLVGYAGDYIPCEDARNECKAAIDFANFTFAKTIRIYLPLIRIGQASVHRRMLNILRRFCESTVCIARGKNVMSLLTK